jgi:hypothetical protein
VLERSNRSTLVTGIGLALVQIVDIIIHVATNQAEPIRITSNIIVLLWLAVLALGSVKTRFRLVAMGVIGAYLALNLIFLALNGVTNVEQGGGLRITLLVLIFRTVALAALLTYFWERNQVASRGIAA